MLKTFAVMTMIIAGTSAVAHGQTAPPVTSRTDLPVKTVMLFSSGVGYFEHAGRVRDNGATELRFKTSQINDILKSLVILDQDGGKVAAITYPSQDPLEKTLRSFQVDITQNPSLADLLNQLRGAHVTVTAQAERLSGTVLGVETRYRTESSGEPIGTSAVAVLNVFSGANIRSIALPSISSLALDDPALQEELSRALSALSQARDQDKKPVTINFNGSGDRRVRIGYVVETPIWKTSYRLLLGEKSSRIQGWAIVENQTESDWDGVALSLVSGRPVSFAMDLYQPLYATRPVVTQELFAGLRPQLYDGGTDSSRARVMLSAVVEGANFSGKGVAGGVGRPANGLLGGRAGANALSAVVVAGNTPLVESVAAAARMGELFQYAVRDVTLARQKSAMLPIVADSVKAERVSIYNASVLQSHPLNGVRLTNTTNKHLLQGPVTVLDGGGYAGDARIDNLPPGQQRLLSFSIDLEVRVDATKRTQNVSVVTGRIQRGLLHIDHKVVSTQEYQADNKGEKDRVLVIEHPIMEGSKLEDTQKPVETTDNLYRFQGTAPAKKVTVLVVKQETVQTATMSMLTTDAAQLTAFTRGGEIPAAVRDAIRKAAGFKEAVAESDRLIAERTRQLSDIAVEQGRLRENMKTVVQSTAYYQRLLAKLNEQESSIETLQRERTAVQSKRDGQQRELETFLSALNIG